MHCSGRLLHRVPTLQPWTAWGGHELKAGWHAERESVHRAREQRETRRRAVVSQLGHNGYFWAAHGGHPSWDRYLCEGLANGLRASAVPGHQPALPSELVLWAGQRTRSPRIHPPPPRVSTLKCRLAAIASLLCLHSSLGDLYINTNICIYDKCYLT